MAIDWRRLVDFHEGEGGRVFASILIIMIAAVLLKLIKKRLRYVAKDGDNEDRRLLIRQFQKSRERMSATRNGIVTVAVMLILGIWGSRIAGFALSVAALAGGILVVSKDFLQNLLGLAMLSFARPFRLGDHVSVAGIEGRVSDIGMLSFSIMLFEGGQRTTGRIANIPNGIVLTQTVHNMSATGEFVMRVIEVGVADIGKVSKAQAALLQAARSVCSDWLNDARDKLHAFARKEMIEVSDVEPHLSLDLRNSDEVMISLSYPCRAREQFKVEQCILLAYVESMASQITLDKHDGDGKISTQ